MRSAPLPRPWPLAFSIIGACFAAAACGPPGPTAVAPAAPPSIAVPVATADQGGEAPPDSAAKEVLFPIFDAQGKHGFIDATGKVVIAPRFEDVGPFREGLAAFRKGKMWGFIDRSGKEVIAPSFRAVRPFSEGLAAAVAREQEVQTGSGKEVTLIDVGYVDRSGGYVIVPRWAVTAGDFSAGLAAIGPDPSSEEAKRGTPYFIAHDGSRALSSLTLTNAASVSEGLDCFLDGMAWVTVKDTGGKQRGVFVDTNGTVVSPPAGFEIAGLFSNGLGPVHGAAAGKWGFIDRTGKLVFSLAVEDASPFSEGLALVDMNGKSGYVRPDGTWAIPAQYACGYSFHDGLARVCDGNDKDERYIDAQGRVVLVGGAGSGWVPRGTPFEEPFFHGGLQYRNLTSATPGNDVDEKVDLQNVYGYRNKAGKYVWLSPNAEAKLEASFWKDQYVGPPRGE